MERIPERPLRTRLTLGSLALFPWVVSYFFIGGGGPDDTHITFYVARELATTGQYVNYDGDALEQSSSMGLVLLRSELSNQHGEDVLLMRSWGMFGRRLAGA